MKRNALAVLVLSLMAIMAACSGPATTSAQRSQIAQPPRITPTSVGSTSATIGVPASNYQVSVVTSGPCFVRATGGTNEVAFSGTVPPGQTHVFATVNGKLSVLLGSVQVKVAVKMKGAFLP